MNHEAEINELKDKILSQQGEITQLVRFVRGMNKELQEARELLNKHEEWIDYKQQVDMEATDRA
jgi:hypothetical protein